MMMEKSCKTCKNSRSIAGVNCFQNVGKCENNDKWEPIVIDKFCDNCISPEEYCKECTNFDSWKGKQNKYLREVQLIDGKIDIYCVLEAFNVTCPARQHAIKKLLCAGIRGKGDTLQDLTESLSAIKRAIELEKNRH